MKKEIHQLIVIMLLSLGMLTIYSCKVSKSSKTNHELSEIDKIAQRHLLNGRKVCEAHMRTVIGENEFNAHVKFLGSVPDSIVAGYTKTGYIYDKLTRVPVSYKHRFILSYDNVIVHDFILISDTGSKFLLEKNKKYSGYVFFVKYAKLINDQQGFKDLMKIGNDYFGMLKFTISFTYKTQPSYEKLNDLTPEERRQISNDPLKYLLMDKYLKDVSPQVKERKELVVDPVLNKIIDEQITTIQYTY